MPRPGPRPYECVRRAWHSDRHQPIRGSLIQEIFRRFFPNSSALQGEILISVAFAKWFLGGFLRLANKVHCPGTRKNKEWQEKLPFVVLKAEEIMYSKANSEAEYMDLKTLWDRANDAIDTIIRRDDANETGDLLQPCIEAALNLGCIPRRTSRSQRHNNTVSYLSPNLKEAADVSGKSQDNIEVHKVRSTSMLPPLLPTQSSHHHGSATQFGMKYSALGADIQFMDSSPSKNQKGSFDNTGHAFACHVRGFPMQMDSCIWHNLGRVYPLYYGQGHSTHLNPEEQIGMNLFGVTMPCVQSNGTADRGPSHEFLRGNKMLDGSNKVSDYGDKGKLLKNTEYDLSLRLGLPSPPTSDDDSAWRHEVEDAGSSSSCDGNKSCGLLPRGAGIINLERSISSVRDKGFDFFSMDANDEHYESCSSMWSSDGDCTLIR